MFWRERGPQRELEHRLGHDFRRPALLEAALTHRSYANEEELGENYERLEFLGDAVLALVAADWLYRRYPAAAEGELSKLKGFLVSEPVLAGMAEGLGLGELIRLGVGEDRSGGRQKPSLLADALEAVIAAVYLDGGLEAARSLVEGLLERSEEKGADWRSRDSKSALQEYLQGLGRPVPSYVLSGSKGPDHERLFTIECVIDGETIGEGVGRSKKLAEQAAAAAALEQLRS